MRLRIRYGSSRGFVEIEPGAQPTLQNLRTKVAEKYSISKTSFDLSLNGKDVIAGGDQALLRTAGIVDGDLVHVLTKEMAAGAGSSGSAGVENSADPQLLTQMVDMGFTKDQSAQALLASGNVNIDRALEVILQQQQQQQQHQQQQASSATQSEQQIVIEQTIEMDQSGTEDSKQGSQSPRVLKPRAILCREGIPATLQEVYRSAGVTNLHDAVLVVVHVLMLETGYLLLHEEGSDASTCTGSSCPQALLPVSWNKGSVKTFHYNHPACPALCFSVACTSLGPYVLVHGVTDSRQSCSIFQSKLLAADFVQGTADLSQQGASSVYRNLHRLSLVVKDKIAYPLLSFARSELGLPELLGFMALPTEIKLMTLRCLPVESVLHVASTCRELHVVTRDPSLWQFLCYRDFGIATKGNSPNWRSEYKRRYEEKKCEERARHFFGMPQPSYFAGPATHVPPGSNFPPGVIGGRSDLFPDLPYMPGGLGPLPGNVQVPRPRFDPFGPTPESDNWSRPGRRGQGPNARGGFPGFHPRFM